MNRTFGLLSLFLLPCLFGAVPPAWAAPAFDVEIVADGLRHPWGLAFLPDGRMLVTERPGRLLLISPDGKTRQTVAGVPPVDARGQGGLLDVALHPEFTENRYVYMTWAGACGDGNATHLGRGRLEGAALRDVETLFVATPCVDSTKHFGSRIAFDPEGYLFVTVGERGERERAQDPMDHNGAVLRLHDDGRIPADNPFVNTDRGQPAIWSWGHRNPQGAAIHPESGRLWMHEHGPRGGDEINVPRPGRNYGWPVITHGREYWGPRIGPDSKPGYEQPIHHWTPSIAPSGMAFYTGDAFPEWRGDLFVGALVQTHLAHLELDGERVVAETELLRDRGWRIRDVRTGPDGYLYLLTDADNGLLVRLVPAR